MIRAIRSRVLSEGVDTGITLIELLVASVISVIMLGLVGSMFIEITRLTANSQSTKNATAVAWTVLNEISDVSRQGTPVATSASVTEGAVIAGSTSTSLMLDSNVNATVAPGQATIAPTRVTFTVDGSGNLVEQRLVGTMTGGYYAFTGTPTSRTVNGPIQTTGTGTNALFVYYTGTAASLVPITPAAAGLTSAQAAQVISVGINISVANSISSGPDPVVLTDQVMFPNVAIVNGGN